MDLSQLTPEQLQQLIALSTLDEEGESFDEQMQQAQALQQPSGHRYSTGLGAALGGFGDVLRSAYGGYQARQAKEGKADLLKRKGEGRKTFADLLLGAGRSIPEEQGLSAPVAFGEEEQMAPFAYGYRPGMGGR